MIRIAVLLAALSAGGDSTFSVTVTVSGMRCGQKCGGIIKEALTTLDASASVARVSYAESKGIGVYKVTLPSTSKFEYAKVADSIHRRYIIERVEIRIVGAVTKDADGLWLTAGGTRLQLLNRQRKDDKDAPPDLVAQLENELKAGRTTFVVDGECVRIKENTAVRMATAQAAETSGAN